MGNYEIFIDGLTRYFNMYNSRLPVGELKLRRKEFIENIKKQVNNNTFNDMDESKVLELLQLIYDKYDYSKVEPNKMVGIIAAHALGEGQTQARLDAKRLTGVSGARRKVDNFDLLESLTKFQSSKIQSDIINFDKDTHYQKIYSLYNDILETKMNDIIVSNSVIETEKEDWREIYKEIFKVESANYHLKIYIDNNERLNRGIKFSEIRDSLKEEFPEYTIMYSLSGSFVEIHTEGRDHSALKNKYREILGKLYDTVIKGIPGIKMIFIEKTSLLSTIKTVESDNGKIRISYSKEKMAEGLLYPEQLAEYFYYRFGVDSIVSDEYIIVDSKLTPEKFKKEMRIFNISQSDYGKLSPSEKLSLKVRDEDLHLDPIPLVNLYQKSLNVYFETDGSNIFEILKLDHVDRTRTYKDDVNWILEYHGVEATRFYYLWKAKQLMSFDMSQTNIELLVDTSLYRDLVKVDYYGHMSQETGALEKMTYERKVGAINEIAFFGDQDALKTTHSGIIASRLLDIGTHSVNLVPQ